jgi:hypothetical protein
MTKTEVFHKLKTQWGLETVAPRQVDAIDRIPSGSRIHSIAEHGTSCYWRRWSLQLWDCWVLASNGRLAVFFSHDEFGTVCTLDKVADDLVRSLDALKAC